MKLNMGCGHNKREGYVNVDMSPVATRMSCGISRLCPGHGKTIRSMGSV